MYNHLTLQMYDPTLERSDYVGKATALQITNRGAVADPAASPQSEVFTSSQPSREKIGKDIDKANHIAYL